MTKFRSSGRAAMALAQDRAGSGGRNCCWRVIDPVPLRQSRRHAHVSQLRHHFEEILTLSEPPGGIGRVAASTQHTTGNLEFNETSPEDRSLTKAVIKIAPHPVKLVGGSQDSRSHNGSSAHDNHDKRDLSEGQTVNGLKSSIETRARWNSRSTREAMEKGSNNIAGQQQQHQEEADKMPTNSTASSEPGVYGYDSSGCSFRTPPAQMSKAPHLEQRHRTNTPSAKTSPGEDTGLPSGTTSEGVKKLLVADDDQTGSHLATPIRTTTNHPTPATSTGIQNQSPASLAIKANVSSMISARAKLQYARQMRRVIHVKEVALANGSLVRLEQLKCRHDRDKYLNYTQFKHYSCARCYIIMPERFKLASLIFFDGCLVNPDSGLDISSEDSQYIRKYFTADFYYELWLDCCYSALKCCIDNAKHLTNKTNDIGELIDDPDKAEQSCPATWDGLSCWPDSPAGKLIEGDCPDHIYYENQKPNCPVRSTKQCLPNGTWFRCRDIEWTEYSGCNGINYFQTRFRFAIIWYCICIPIMIPALFVLKRMPDRRGGKRIKIIKTILFWLLLQCLIDFIEKWGLLEKIFQSQTNHHYQLEHRDARRIKQIMELNANEINNSLIGPYDAIDINETLASQLPATSLPVRLARSPDELVLEFMDNSEDHVNNNPFRNHHFVMSDDKDFENLLDPRPKTIPLKSSLAFDGEVAKYLETYADDEQEEEDANDVNAKFDNYMTVRNGRPSTAIDHLDQHLLSKSGNENLISKFKLDRISDPRTTIYNGLDVDNDDDNLNNNYDTTTNSATGVLVERDDIYDIHDAVQGVGERGDIEKLASSYLDNNIDHDHELIVDIVVERHQVGKVRDKNSAGGHSNVRQLFIQEPKEYLNSLSSSGPSTSSPGPSVGLNWNPISPEERSEKLTKPSSARHQEEQLSGKCEYNCNSEADYAIQASLPQSRARRHAIGGADNANELQTVQGSTNTCGSAVNSAHMSNPGTVFICWILQVIKRIVRQISYGWIFTGAVYLCSLLIYAPADPPRHLIKWLIIVLNTIPVLLGSVYVIVRSIYEKSPIKLVLVPHYTFIEKNSTKVGELLSGEMDCWIVNSGLYFIEEIIQLPNLIFVVLNFTLFMFTLIIMCRISKPGSSRPEMSLYNYAKAAGTLVMLYGTHYLLVIYQGEDEDCIVSEIRSYLLVILDGLQGVIVSYVFCFSTPEGQEVIKKWYKHAKSNFTAWLSCQTAEDQARQRGFSRTSSNYAYQRSNGCRKSISVISENSVNGKEVTIELSQNE